MIVERGKIILFVCMIVVFVGILTHFIITSEPVYLVRSSLWYGLFFFLTYRGYNWSRICLFISLLISGLFGSYFGVMFLFEYPYPAGTILVIKSILYLAVGFILLLNKSVKKYVNRES